MDPLSLALRPAQVRLLRPPAGHDDRAARAHVRVRGRLARARSPRGRAHVRSRGEASGRGAASGAHARERGVLQGRAARVLRHAAGGLDDDLPHAALRRRIRARRALPARGPLDRLQLRAPPKVQGAKTPSSRGSSSSVSQTHPRTSALCGTHTSPRAIGIRGRCTPSSSSLSTLSSSRSSSGTCCGARESASTRRRRRRSTRPSPRARAIARSTTSATCLRPSRREERAGGAAARRASPCRAAAYTIRLPLRPRPTKNARATATTPAQVLPLRGVGRRRALYSRSGMKLRPQIPARPSGGRRVPPHRHDGRARVRLEPQAARRGRAALRARFHDRVRARGAPAARATRVRGRS